MHLTPGVVHNLPKAKGFLSPMHKKISDSYSKREGGNPGNSGLVSTIDGSTLPQVGVEELLCGTPSTW